MTTPTEIAARWAGVRKQTKLSRQAFAERTGLTPGAVWRIETKGLFKPGESEKLEAVFPEGSLISAGPAVISIQPVPAAPQKPPLALPSPVVSSSTAVPPPPPLEVPWYVGHDDLQWLDPVPAPPPLLTPSPTELFEQDGTRRYSNSEIGTFEDCERRWWLTFYRGLGSRYEEPTGIREIGNRVHRALEMHYAPPGVASVDPRQALELVLEEDWRAIETQHALRGYDPSPELRETFKREGDLQRAMVAGYLEWVKETGADSDIQVVEPEAYLEVDLEEVNAKIIAKIDVRVMRPSDQARMWLEHKTVGSISQRLKTVTMDEQVLHQTLVENLHGAENGAPRVVGVIYNLIRRVKRGVQAKPPFFQRVEVHHNVHELESFRKRTALRIRRIEMARRQLDKGVDHRDVVTPRPSSECSWKCPFVQICPMLDDGSRAEAALAQYFQESDPYAYYVKEKG